MSANSSKLIRGEVLVNVFGVPFFSPDASARRKINTRPAINTKIPGKNVEKIPQKCDFFRSQKCVLDLPEVFFFGRFAADYSRSLPVYQDKKNPSNYGMAPQRRILWSIQSCTCNSVRHRDCYYHPCHPSPACLHILQSDFLSRSKLANLLQSRRSPKTMGKHTEVDFANWPAKIMIFKKGKY